MMVINILLCVNESLRLYEVFRVDKKYSFHYLGDDSSVGGPADLLLRFPWNDYYFQVREPFVCAQRITEAIVYGMESYNLHTVFTPHAKKP